MNGYKKIIKSPEMRKKILDAMCFVPDETMLKLQYRVKLGRKLNLTNPKRFTEKLQWYKLHYHDPLMRQCVDKYEVRKFVADRGLQDILVPLINTYKDIDDIDLDELPDEFVMKTTNGGGGLNVAVCSDKTTLNWADIKAKIESSDQVFKPHSGGREWAYYGLKRKIVIEKLLKDKKNPEAGITDYKIFCYNGVSQYIIVDVDRYIGHKRNFYDCDWNNLHVISDCPASDREIERPQNLDQMLEIARKLSENFPFVRVDLYNIEGKIYFGEMTFYPWSGYVQYYPDQFDYELGKKFTMSEIVGGARELHNNFIVERLCCQFSERKMAV